MSYETKELGREGNDGSMSTTLEIYTEWRLY